MDIDTAVETGQRATECFRTRCFADHAGRCADQHFQQQGEFGAGEREGARRPRCASRRAATGAGANGGSSTSEADSGLAVRRRMARRRATSSRGLQGLGA